MLHHTYTVLEKIIVNFSSLYIFNLYENFTLTLDVFIMNNNRFSLIEALGRMNKEKVRQASIKVWSMGLSKGKGSVNRVYGMSNY